MAGRPAVVPERILTDLYAVIRQRRTADPAQSYTARTMGKGRLKLAQKLGEEAVETVIAAVAGSDRELAEESADLLYHLLMVLADRDVPPVRVMEVLAARRGLSGLAEKAGRAS